MAILNHQYLQQKAIAVLHGAASDHGIKASSEVKDNYGRIWARDTAVAGLAIITNQLSELYTPLKYALVKLKQAASEIGQIPSNLQVNDEGEIIAVSFGGPVGRVDTSFWWVISSVIYLGQNEDHEFKLLVEKQCDAIFKLANSWEFNGKGLMYVPMSSNWADEYVTNGYVLYDQILRYWALSLASEYFGCENWGEKALQVKINIKQHFLLEADLTGSLYTKAQQQSLDGFNIGEHFIASFSPGDRVERFDAWSMALLMLLDIPSAATLKGLNKAVLKILAETQNKGIPAFWPVIAQDDQAYQTLQFNHSYDFKNKPGHFHNGGIWPVVNGFLVAGLMSAGLSKTATIVLNALIKQLIVHMPDAPFAEYFDGYQGRPGGVNNLCFSASGYLLATRAVSDMQLFNDKIKPGVKNEVDLLNAIKQGSEKILTQLNLDKNAVTAISIAGESGSGKTTLSACFAEVLTQQGFNVLVFHQDDYFTFPPKRNHNARVRDFSVIGPGEVRLALLDEHIKHVKSGSSQKLSVPTMNWITDREEVKQVDTNNINIILVDGTYTTLLKQTDYRILINTSYEQTRKNRIKRNRETVTNFIENVLKREREIIQSHYAFADIIIDQQLTVVTSVLKPFVSL